VPLPAGAAAALLSPDRRPACAPRDLAGPIARDRSRPARVRGAARARGARAQGAGVGGDLDPAPVRGGVGGARPRRPRLRARTARPRRGPHPREAPLAPAARGAPCGNTSGDTPVSAVARAQTRAAWFFLAPALLLIGLFFFVPVLAGLLLSATDFDVYA